MSTNDVRGGTRSTGSLGMTAYEAFIDVMTSMSLLLATYLLLDRSDPLGFDTPDQIIYILVAMDLMFCLVFLVDFVRSLLVAPSKAAYLFGERPGRSLPYGSLELIRPLTPSRSCSFCATSVSPGSSELAGPSAGRELSRLGLERSLEVQDLVAVAVAGGNEDPTVIPEVTHREDDPCP